MPIPQVIEQILLSLTSRSCWGQRLRRQVALLASTQTSLWPTLEEEFAAEEATTSAICDYLLRYVGKMLVMSNAHVETMYRHCER